MVGLFSLVYFIKHLDTAASHLKTFRRKGGILRAKFQCDVIAERDLHMQESGVERS